MEIFKKLSKNDVGQTGSGQEGITVPNKSEYLSFFPILDKNIKNPRVEVIFRDLMEKKWEFSFVYYNNKFFGGTRNEYRLSKTKSFIRQNDLVAGDSLLFSYKSDKKRVISFLKKKNNMYLNESGIKTIKIKNVNSWYIVKGSIL